MFKPSEIDICCLALTLVGAAEIRDFSERNGPACQRYFNFDLRWLLARFDWSFARKRVKLQALSTPESETCYTYAYRIPSDCLAPRKLEPGGSTVKWEVYGRELHTDVENAYLLYTKHVTDMDLISTIFCELLALRMASRLSQTLGSDKTLRRELSQEFKMEYELAILEDAEIGSEYLRDDLNPDNDPWNQT